MNTKLTLTLEKSVIEKAKRYAKQSGRSLSGLVESYLEKVVQTTEDNNEIDPEEFRDLFGSVQLPNDDKETIRLIIRNKFER